MGFQNMNKENIYLGFIVVLVVLGILFKLEGDRYKSKYLNELSNKQQDISEGLGSSQDSVLVIIDTVEVEVVRYINDINKDYEDLKNKLKAIDTINYLPGELEAFRAEYEARADSVRKASR
jgi:hypothetical protein